jgi:hypothetical protein
MPHHCRPLLSQDQSAPPSRASHSSLIMLPARLSSKSAADGDKLWATTNGERTDWHTALLVDCMLTHLSVGEATPPEVDCMLTHLLVGEATLPEVDCMLTHLSVGEATPPEVDCMLTHLSVGEATPPEAITLMQWAPRRSSSRAALRHSSDMTQRYDMSWPANHQQLQQQQQQQSSKAIAPAAAPGGSRGGQAKLRNYDGMPSSSNLFRSGIL